MKDGRDSFAERMRKELLGVLPETAEEAKAELCGMLPALSAAGEDGLAVRTENGALPRKVFTLLEKAFNINGAISSDKCRIGGRGGYCIRPVPGVREILSELSWEAKKMPDEMCCHAFLRGAFLTAGTVSDPARAYRFEIICADRDRAAFLREILQRFGLRAKETGRGGDVVVYLQDGMQVAEAVARTGANVAYLSFENVRILNDVRGNVNRKVNCETSNLQKAVRAGVRQIREIDFLEEMGALGSMSAHLQEIARVRREHPDATLTQIGALLSPPIGRSGANHRLHELMAAAERIRNQENKEG